LKKLRKIFTLSDVVLILSHYLPDLFRRLQLPAQPTPIKDTIDVKLHSTSSRAHEMMQYPETQLFLYDLLLMKLVDDGDLKNAKEFGDFIYMRLKNVNLRTLDNLAAKAFYMIAVVYEKQGKLHEIRPFMFEVYKTCCLKHD
jgi:26S proteasome regulatory subunit N3